MCFLNRQPFRWSRSIMVSNFSFLNYPTRGCIIFIAFVIFSRHSVSKCICVCLWLKSFNWKILYNFLCINKRCNNSRNKNKRKKNAILLRSTSTYYRIRTSIPNNKRKSDIHTGNGPKFTQTLLTAFNYRQCIVKFERRLKEKLHSIIIFIQTYFILRNTYIFECIDRYIWLEIYLKEWKQGCTQ